MLHVQPIMAFFTLPLEDFAYSMNQTGNAGVFEFNF